MSWENFSLGAGAIGGLVGMVANPFLQARQNRQNLKMMREQNAFNSQEAQKNRDWQMDMWNKNNEYNDPSAWRDRMEQAGFNAWNYNGGNQSSAMSGAQASAAGMPSLAAPQIDSNPFISAANSFAQMRIADRGMRVTEAQSPYQINLMDSQARGNDTAAWYTRNYQAPFTFEQSLNSTLQRHVMGAQLQNVMASTAYTNIQTLTAGTSLQYLSQEKQVSIANQVAGTLLMYEQGKFTRQQVRESIARTLNIAAMTEGQEISNKVANDTAEKLIEFTNAYNGNQSYYQRKLRNTYVNGQNAFMQRVYGEMWQNNAAQHEGKYKGFYWNTQFNNKNTEGISSFGVQTPYGGFNYMNGPRY